MRTFCICRESTDWERALQPSDQDQIQREKGTRIFALLLFQEGICLKLAMPVDEDGSDWFVSVYSLYKCCCWLRKYRGFWFEFSMQTFTAVEWTKIDQGQTHPILLIYEQLEWWSNFYLDECLFLIKFTKFHKIKSLIQLGRKFKQSLSTFSLFGICIWGDSIRRPS